MELVGKTEKGGMIEVPTFVIITFAVIVILIAVAILVTVLRRTDQKIADKPATDLNSEQWLPDYSDSKVPAEKITLGYTYMFLIQLRGHGIHMTIME